MPDINLLNIHKFYGSNHILKGLNITIKKGDFISIIGGSGSGKTTLLKIISGLISPEYGEIYFDNELSNFKDTRNRKIGYIFQDYTLYPNMTVFDNILFSLKKEKEKYDEKVKMVYLILEKLGIKELESAFPKELSFGQQQKVSIAKNIIKNPEILLFDEPLSNIDEKKRSEFRLLLKEIKEYLPDTTFIYVTHSIYDCINLGVRTALIDDGVIKYYGDIQLIYNYPITKEYLSLFHEEYSESDATIKDGEVIGDNIKYTLSDFQKSFIKEEYSNLKLFYRGRWFSMYDDSKCLVDINNHLAFDAKEDDVLIINDSLSLNKDLYFNRLLPGKVSKAIFDTSYISFTNESDSIEIDTKVIYKDEIYTIYDFLGKNIVLNSSSDYIKLYYPISRLDLRDENNNKLLSSYELNSEQSLIKYKVFDCSTEKKKGYKKYKIINYELMGDYSLVYVQLSGYSDYVAIKTNTKLNDKKIIYIKEV